MFFSWKILLISIGMLSIDITWWAAVRRAGSNAENAAAATAEPDEYWRDVVDVELMLEVPRIDGKFT